CVSWLVLLALVDPGMSTSDDVAGGAEPTQEYGVLWVPVRCPGDCLCSDCSGAGDMWADAQAEMREELGEDPLGPDA
ncbi:hypothetical protein, partial [Bacillus thuringiensis]